MATFKDNDGRDWELRVLPINIARIREDCDPEFLKGEDHLRKTSERLHNDPLLLCRVLYLLAFDQCTKRTVGEEEFYLGVLGNSIEAATDALRKSLMAFTPPWMREALEASTAKVEELQRKSAKQLMATLETPEFEERIKAIAAERAGVISMPWNGADVSPVSAESTPAI